MAASYASAVKAVMKTSVRRMGLTDVIARHGVVDRRWRTAAGNMSGYFSDHVGGMAIWPS